MPIFEKRQHIINTTARLYYINFVSGLKTIEVSMIICTQTSFFQILCKVFWIILLFIKENFSNLVIVNTISILHLFFLIIFITLMTTKWGKD